jgi:hypothetical protein
MGSGFGGAHTGSSDLRGVAELDAPKRMSLEELVGLDSKVWTIVGLDIWETSRDTGFAILAAPRDSGPKADGTLAVTKFEMPGTTGAQLLHRLGRWSIHAQRSGSEDVVLKVEGESKLDFPMKRYEV